MINKLIACGLSVVLSCAAFNSVAFAEDNSTFNVDAKAAIIMESTTGNIIYEQNADERLAPASVTKVMTILLIYESVEQGKIKWDDMVTISSHAAGMGGSQIFLEPMEQQTVRDLTKSIVIASANDAAVAMAEFIGGSEEYFVGLMNQRAAELGMKNTNFQNACGLDTDNHYTSARDIAIMSKELILKHPEVKDVATVWMDTIYHKTAKGVQEFGLTNTNKLVKWYDGATGLKTGSTGKAFYCLSGTAQRNGMELISVVLAAPTAEQRFREVMKMFDYGFANYQLTKGDEPATSYGQVKVYKGQKESVGAVSKGQVTVLTKKGIESKLTTEIKLVEAVSAPVQKGSKVGEIIYYYDGARVGSCDLVTDDDIDKSSITDMIKKLTNKWFD